MGEETTQGPKKGKGVKMMFWDRHFFLCPQIAVDSGI